MSEDLFSKCDLFYYSGCGRERKKNAVQYLSRQLGHPEKGSIFYERLGNLKYLFRLPVANGIMTRVGLAHLLKKDYDALMLSLNDEIIGHTGFQTHSDDSLHIFSIGVNPIYRLNGLAKGMVEEILYDARREDIERIRIGGGNNMVTNKIHANFSRREKELGITAFKGNWIEVRM